MNRLVFAIFFFGIISLAIGQQPNPKHLRNDYNLVWSDEFNGKHLDTTKWNHRSLGKRKFGTVVQSASRVDGRGNLVIKVSKKDSIYEIGQIATQYSFLTTYGYFECRVKLNKKLGPHTAFWLQSPTVGKENNNPAENGTEIDVFEYHIKEGRENIYHNIHWNGYGKVHKSEGTVVNIPKVFRGYHVFGLEWTSEAYIFYVDGKETWRTSTAISHRPEYMILSAELTGWGGNFRTEKFPDKVKFDYVRVYQKNKDGK